MSRVGRRTFLLATGALLAAPPARAQQRGMPVIGFLNGASYELSRHLVSAFHQGLGETGYVEGQNVAIDYRSADGVYDAGTGGRSRSPAGDRDGRDRHAYGTPGEGGHHDNSDRVRDRQRPARARTCLQSEQARGQPHGRHDLAVELGRKRMELLREMIPKATLIGVLVNPTGPNLQSVLRDVHAAARTLGLPIRILHASTVGDFDMVFATLVQLRASALQIGTDTFFNSQSGKLGALTVRHAVPAIYQYREFVAAGGLMSYAGSITDAYRLAGIYTGRILKGEKPADLSVQQSAKAELFVNLKTAKTLGITVPQSILARADEVIH
jgi:putative ABC transport system substrate-binding protein